MFGLGNVQVSKVPAYMVCIAVCIFLSACASDRQGLHPNIRSERDIYNHQEKRDKVVAVARQQLGAAYKYAGNGPRQWDCSGLTYHAFDKVGIRLARTSASMANMAEGIRLAEAKPGDLVFFKKDGRVFHVSIITENSKDRLWVVHSSTSRGVIEEDIYESQYWAKKIYKVISLATLLSN